MDIPIDVEVLCAGKECGHSTSLVINPVNDRVTHIVVTEEDFPNVERLVPVDRILASSPAAIQLRCSPEDLSAMPPFMQTDFIDGGRLESSMPYSAPFQVWPYSMYDVMPIPMQHEQLPTGEVAIHRGTSVVATNGPVGKVDEFLVDPENDAITHLVLREGHLWGKKDVTIPISEIEWISEEEVRLKLDKKGIESLPSIPVRRKWK